MRSAIAHHRIMQPVAALKESYVLPLLIGGLVLVIVVLALGEYGNLCPACYQASTHGAPSADQT
jgi:hypothetical protein